MIEFLGGLQRQSSRSLGFGSGRGMLKLMSEKLVVLVQQSTAASFLGDGKVEMLRSLEHPSVPQAVTEKQHEAAWAKYL